MTVRDLIEFLERLPKDTQIGVVYRACSDLVILEENDLTFTDKAYLDRHGLKLGEADRAYRNRRNRRYVLRHGKLMEYDERTWPPDEVPHFVPVLILPGN